MKIVNLIENTEGREGCAYAHGLSFYVETSRHKLLLDLGPSEETCIMPFVKINPEANIYMQDTADADYYADDGENAEGGRYKYIGIDKNISEDIVYEVA